jgi:hypothetical protein
MRIPAFSKSAKGLTLGLVMTKNPFTGVTGKGFSAKVSEPDGCLFNARRYLMEKLEKFTVVAGKEHIRRNIDPEKQRLTVRLQFLSESHRAGHMWWTTPGQTVIFATRLPAAFGQLIFHDYFFGGNDDCLRCAGKAGTCSQFLKMISSRQGASGHIFNVFQKVLLPFIVFFPLGGIKQ